jgi:hypothetical protein
LFHSLAVNYYSLHGQIEKSGFGFFGFFDFFDFLDFLDFLDFWDFDASKSKSDVRNRVEDSQS